MIHSLVGRLLLLAFPRHFRERLGRDLLRTLETDSRTATGAIAPGRYLGGAIDLVRAGIAERLAARRDRGHHRSLADVVWQDARYSVRRLRHSAGFTTVAILTLALGIGANASMFQLLDAVQLRKLSIPAPDELAEIRLKSDEAARGSFSIWHAGTTYGIWQQIRDRQEAFSGVFACPRLSRSARRMSFRSPAIPGTTKSGSTPWARRRTSMRRRESTPSSPSKRFEIVGLVKNAKYENLRDDLAPTVYLAASQALKPRPFAQLLIRTGLPEAGASQTLKTAFKAIHPAIVPTFQDYRGVIGQSLAQDELVAALAAFFGALSLLLATIGVYGSLSFAVARRTREIGVRLALGADRAGILTMVLREAMTLVAAGCLIGGTATLLLGRTVRSLLYRIEPQDPLTIAGAIAMLAVVALAACLLPARRAARLDPTIAFRVE